MTLCSIIIIMLVTYIVVCALLAVISPDYIITASQLIIKQRFTMHIMHTNASY